MAVMAVAGLNAPAAVAQGTSLGSAAGVSGVGGMGGPRVGFSDVARNSYFSSLGRGGAGAYSRGASSLGTANMSAATHTSGFRNRGRGGRRGGANPATGLRNLTGGVRPTSGLFERAPNFGVDTRLNLGMLRYLQGRKLREMDLRAQEQTRDIVLVTRLPKPQFQRIMSTRELLSALISPDTFSAVLPGEKDTTEEEVTVSYLIEQHIEMVHGRLLSKGMNELRERNHHLARAAFESAEDIKPNSYTSQLGLLLVAVAEEHYQLASELLNQLVVAHPSFFADDIDLKQVLGSTYLVKLYLERCHDYLDKEGSKASPYALYAFLNWCAGFRDEAIDYADRLKELFPTASISVMADHMHSAFDMNSQAGTF